MTRCKNRGIESTSRNARAIAAGVGLNSEEIQLCESDQDMTAWVMLRMEEG